MKAVVCQDAELSVREVPEQIPQKGQVLLKVLRCGICGCDLHMHHHCDDMRDLLEQDGYAHFPSSQQSLVFGHEFCGEILDYGAGSERKYAIGTRVCVMPLLQQGADVDLLGMSARAPGAYAERVLVQESMMLPIPDGVSDSMAALAEPLAQALHAVRRSEIKSDDVAIVVGCGPIGLAMICVLKALGVQTVVASDFSAEQRELAVRCGADEVVDLEDDVPYADWAKYGFTDSLSAQLQETVAMRDRFEQPPMHWWHNRCEAEAQDRVARMPVIFECVGQAGALQTIAEGAPMLARVVVTGVCRQPDELEPIMASNKELDIRLSKGYLPSEYRDVLHLLAEGRLHCEALVTGVVGLEGVDGAFEALRQREQHGKVLIDPGRLGSAMVAP